MLGLKTTLGGFTLSAVMAAPFFLHSPLVAAHARWDLNGIVKPRTDAANLKSGPCGGIPKKTTPTTFSPGQTITVSFEETVNHPGYYRIAFSPANDQGFSNNILLDNIQDTKDTETPLPHFFSASITLPMQPCDACTLQLIQVMTDSNPSSNYYSCSDIKLVDGGGTTPPPPPPPPPSPPPAPLPTDPKQIAQNLLEDFSVADADKNAALTLTEAQMILPGLTLLQFTTLDGNNNGTLTTLELNAVITPTTTDSKAPPEAAAGSIDWSALLGLLAFSLRRLRKSLDLT